MTLLGCLLFALPQAPAAEPGFVTLFDGRTLDGWVTQGGRYDGVARWAVEDGCIVGRQGPNGEGGLLYTAEPHASFELRLEVKLDHPFDSGVFVRMAPEGKGAQVTLDWRDDGEIGAIYSDGFLAHNERGATDRGLGPCVQRLLRRADRRQGPRAEGPRRLGCDGGVGACGNRRHSGAEATRAHRGGAVSPTRTRQRKGVARAAGYALARTGQA